MNEKAIEELVESSEEISEVDSFFRPDITYELLYEMYVVKGMSTRKIARELGCSKSTICSKLKEFGIKVRSKSEALRDETVWSADWTQFQKEVLDGMLLGDGNIHIPEGCISGYYQQACKHREFVEHIMGIFPNIFGENNPYPTVSVKDGIEYEDWAIRSKVNEYLTEQHYRYFPKGVKVIPRGLVVTPTVLLYWYLGDGNLGDSETVSIRCTSLYDGLDLVIPQLEEMGLYFRKWEGCIGLPRECNDRFFELIGHSPVECYLYKYPFDFLTVEERKLAIKYKQGLL